MANDNPNVETLKWAYGHWVESKGKSVEAWLVIVSDDVQIRSAVDQYAAAQFGSVPPGKKGVRQYLAGVTQNWQMELYDVRRYVAQGDEVAVLIECAWRHRRTNRLVANTMANFWTFRDGKAIEMVEMFDTASVLAAAQPAR